MLTKSDIEWLKSEFLPALAEAVKKDLLVKMENIDIKLDGFLGEILDKRETQELHSNDHFQMNERLERVEKELKLPPLS